MGVSLNVQVVRGGQLVGQHAFDSDVHRTIKIGRLPSAQLKIEDPKVSRIHAVIEFAGGDVSLIDMGSTVGTTVNGTKIHKVKLGNGDQVAIGDTQLIVGLGGAGQPMMASAPAQAPQPAPAPGFGAPGGFAPGGAGAPFASPGAAPPAWPQPGAAPGPAGRSPLTMPAAAAMHGGIQARSYAASAMPIQQPRFDPGGGDPSTPMRRITKERLRAAAVESRPHPALPPEDVMTKTNRVIEMRLYWGEILLSIDHYDRPKRITIGESKHTDVFISSEGLPVEAFPLLRYSEPEYVLTFARGMEGEVELGGTIHTLQDLRGSSLAHRDDDLEGCYQVTLPPDARGLVHWGGATFALRFVAPPKPIPNPFLKNLDLQYLNMLLMSIFLHVALVVTFLVYPYDTESLNENLFAEPDRFAKLVLEAPKETQSTKDLLKKIKETVEKKKIEEKPPEPTKTKLRVAKVETTKRPRPSREQRQAEIKQKFTRLFAGTGGGGGGMGSILGGGGGGTLSGTLSNVIGTTGRGSATAGLAGLGIRGGALTGGGIGTSRGIAGIGTAGRLGGGGMAYGSKVGLGGRKDRGLTGFGTPVVMGSLSMDVIRKVVNENRRQIQYCYEVELQRNQSLEGKVAVKWIIAATGSVAKVMVTESTINNRNVERCLMAKIRTWKFPAPAGGGIVEVNYPFIFKASG